MLVILFRSLMEFRGYKIYVFFFLGTLLVSLPGALLGALLGALWGGQQGSVKC